MITESDFLFISHTNTDYWCNIPLTIHTTNARILGPESAPGDSLMQSSLFESNSVRPVQWRPSGTAQQCTYECVSSPGWPAWSRIYLSFTGNIPAHVIPPCSSGGLPSYITVADSKTPVFGILAQKLCDIYSSIGCALSSFRSPLPPLLYSYPL